jgi:hypothetical protein
MEKRLPPRRACIGYAAALHEEFSIGLLRRCDAQQEK